MVKAGVSVAEKICMRFEDKVCIVSGGGSGIGRACCERFAREGGRLDIL
jgi:glucose 1-dehydrogenase